MRRAAAQQAAALARATLENAGSRAPGSCAASTLASAWAHASGAPAVSSAGVVAAARPAASAAAATVLFNRGLWGWAGLPATTSTPSPSHSAACGQHQQQRGAASAQAEPSTSTSVSEASASGAEAGGAAGGLALSDAAVQRLKELQGESGQAMVLRVTVEGGGCSGFQYEFAMQEGGGALAETDRLFEREGVRVVCDDISLEFLKGATVDYESDLMRSAFVIATNPNAASSCGCGSSFVAK